MAMTQKEAERGVLDAMRGHLEGVLRERLITFDVAGERLAKADQKVMKEAVKVVLGVLDGNPVRDRAEHWKLAPLREQHLRLIRATMGLIDCLAKGQATLPKAAWQEILPHVKPANEALALAMLAENLDVKTGKPRRKPKPPAPRLTISVRSRAWKDSGFLPDVKGKNVWLRPPAGTSPEAIESLVQYVKRRGAKAVSVAEQKGGR